MTTKFCVSGQGRVVNSIFCARDAGLLDLTGASIIVDRQTSFLSGAERYGVPLEIVDRARFASKDEFREALSESLLVSTSDNLFLTFDWLLPSRVVQRFENRVVNLHMALLPLFKGRGAINQAISSGMKLAGVTYHIVDEGMDTGPTIAQAVHAIGKMTPDELGFALFCRAVPLGIQVMRWIETGRLLDRQNPNDVQGARFSDGPFFPDIDEDIREFAERHLRDNFGVRS